MKSVLSFIFKLFITLISAFLIQIFILHKLEHPLFDNYIIQGYLLNFILALIIYLFIYNFKDVLKYQIGFIFIGGSFLKFLFFFIIFYPRYKEDDVISKAEFAAFFIPYVICLVVETLSIIKILKTLEFKNKRFFVLLVKSYICKNFTVTIICLICKRIFLETFY